MANIDGSIELHWWHLARIQRPSSVCKEPLCRAPKKPVQADSLDIQSFVAYAHGDNSIEVQLPEPTPGIFWELMKSPRTAFPFNFLRNFRDSTDGRFRRNVIEGMLAIGYVFYH
jgi:hypothetical protein